MIRSPRGAAPGAGDAIAPGPAGPSAAAGKHTLTQLLSTSPMSMPAPGRSGTAAGPAPTRVADAREGEPRLNAVLEVMVIDGGEVVQRWQSKARWEGPLPVRWTATRAGGRWAWDHADARSLRVQTDARGGGGKPVEAWAEPSADRIVVHVQAIDTVTIEADAEADTAAPGHAKDARDAGDGSKTRTAPGDEALGPSAADEALGPSAADAALADAFERELGVDSDGDGDGRDGEGPTDRAGGEAGGGRGETGGDREGRTGADTRRGGTGPGGAQARPTGKGKGSEDGRGAQGSEAGTRDGQQGGDEEGMYGGEGAHGDRGVPSAVALFGGLVAVPAALRGFVELALILTSADVTGAGAQLFKRGLGKLASAAAARRMIAHEARLVAVRETKAVIRRVSTDKKTAAAWAQATAEERRQATRIIYWELQRKYFRGYLDAAKQAKAQAQAALRKAPRSADAQRSLASAEMAEEAATASPVAGRLPQNHELAGKPFPRELLPARYRKQGLRFTDTGFPDFEPHALTLPNGKKYVEIRYTGSREADFAAANAKAGYPKTPKDYTWHHSEELGRMYLVPSELHKQVKHTGGVATYKHVTGDVASYAD